MEFGIKQAKECGLSSSHGPKDCMRMITCIRCRKEHPLFSKTKSIHFCPACHTYFHQFALVDGVNYGKDLSFYCNAYYWETTNVFSTTFTPQNHMVVCDDAFLIPLASLPKYRKVAKTQWKLTDLLLEMYIVEWTTSKLECIASTSSSEMSYW